MDYFVYILECKDGSFYTGFTSNLNKRLFEHNNTSLGAKSIKNKLPAKLVHKERFIDMVEALKREKEIKGWSRKKKIRSISNALALRSE